MNAERGTAARWERAGARMGPYGGGGRVVLFALALSCAGAREAGRGEVASAPAAPSGPSAQELFDRAVADFEAGRFAEARVGFGRVAELVPGRASVHYDLGLVAERLGDFKEAAAQLEVARGMDPSRRETVLALAGIYRRQERWSDVTGLLERALAHPALSQDALLKTRLADALREAGRFEEAEAAARRALTAAPDSADAYRVLGSVYADQGRLRLAEIVLGTARRLNGKDPAILNALALVAMKQGSLRGAVGALEGALAIDPEHLPAVFNRGAIALAHRDYERAERLLARATALEPVSYEVWMAYAWALDGQKGQRPEKGGAAGRAFERALALRESQGDAICGAGWSFAQDKGAWDKALRYLEACKGVSSVSPADRQAIDNKIRGIVALQRSGQAATATGSGAGPAKATSGGPAKGASVLDRVSDEAAAAEGAGPSGDVQKSVAPVQGGGAPDASGALP